MHELFIQSSFDMYMVECDKTNRYLRIVAKCIKKWYDWLTDWRWSMKWGNFTKWILVQNISIIYESETLQIT